jgi:hypothetical protein
MRRFESSLNQIGSSNQLLEKGNAGEIKNPTGQPNQRGPGSPTPLTIFFPSFTFSLGLIPSWAN